MPDLDYLGELGPRLQITLAKAARDAKIDLELPLRAVFSTDFSSIMHRGYVFNPELAYQHEDFLKDGLRVKLSIAASFADAGLMDYFYGVAPKFATAARPAYVAKSGYLGSQIAFRLLKPLSKRIKIFGRAAIGLHHGASNDASPLYRDDVTYSAGLGLSYSFWQSEQMSTD
jgi:outer membrane scaffolding protein for murein synthesis (MipA/OmpV family)